MPRRSERIPVRAPTGGIDGRFSELHLPRDAAAELHNMYANGRDVLAKRMGSTLLGSNLPLDGPVMLIDQFYKRDGRQWLVAVTTGGFYFYDTSDDEWKDISPDGGLDGSVRDIVSADILYDASDADDYFIFTNGADALMEWNGDDEKASPVPDTDFSAKHIRAFHSRLFAFHLPDEPQLIRWTAPGTRNDWDGPGSGFIMLSGVDWIVGAEVIGPFLVVFKERSIVVASPTGIADDPFRFEEIISGIGLPSSRSIINLSNEALFFSWDNFYDYTGGRSVEAVGDAVQSPVIQSVNSEEIGQSLCKIFEDRNEVWFVIPSGSSPVPNEAWIYNYQFQKWYKAQKSMSGFGYWQREVALRYQDAEGTFGEQTLRFGDKVFSGAAPLVVYGTPEGNVYFWDETRLSDDGEPYEAVFVTPVFEGPEPEKYNRWLGLDALLRGNKVELSYRVDEGDWVVWGEKELGVDWKREQFDFDVSGKTIQFRFRNGEAGSGFEIRGYEPKLIVSTSKNGRVA